MRKLFIAIIMFCCVVAYGQTEVTIGTGVLEQSRNIGIGLATSAGLNQTIYKGLGTSLVYTYGFLQTGNTTLYLDNGDSLSLPEDGSSFQQLALLLNYTMQTNDGFTGVRVNGGVAKQVSGGIHPAFGLDIIAYPDSKVHPYLSWTPVIRDGFGSGSGWTHTVTLNLAIKVL